MDPISNVDRITLLLRQRLLDRDKAGAASGASAVAVSRSAQPNGGIRGLAAVAALGALDDDQLCRALIQSVLGAEFGSALINDAKFQQVVDQVTEALRSDQGARAILARAVADLRADPR